MNLSDFLPEVRLEVSGCPEAVLLNALRHALREFCDRSQLWAETLADITLTAATASYALPLTAGTELSAVAVAKYRGVPVAIRTDDEMDEAVTDWEAVTGTGVSAVIPKPTTVRVYPIPSADDAYPLVVRAVLRPTLTATTCSDDLAAYARGIAHGAIAQLKATPNKPWTALEMVAYHQGVFDAAVAKAEVAKLRGHSNRSLRVKPVRFA